MGLLLCAALWVGLCWVHMRFAINCAWVPMGSSVFAMGSCRVILGSAASCRYLQCVSLGFLLGSGAFCRDLQWVPLGFRFLFFAHFELEDVEIGA